MGHPVITLLSDMGLGNASVANAQGVLRQHIPACVIADISHSVAPYDLQQAAYLLQSTYHHFPRRTVHVLLIDVLSGDGRGMLLAEKDGFYFVAPDNGILPLVFGEALDNTLLCVKPEQSISFKEWMGHVTLVAEKIFSGDELPYERYDTMKNTRQVKPGMTPGGMDCGIQYIDRYGNVVLDMTREQFELLVREKPFRIKVTRSDITVISKHYDDVAEGAPLCRFNDAGFLEIALNRSSAAGLLGLDVNNPGSLHYQSIRIFL